MLGGLFAEAEAQAAAERVDAWNLMDWSREFGCDHIPLHYMALRYYLPDLTFGNDLETVAACEALCVALAPSRQRTSGHRDPCRPWEYRYEENQTPELWAAVNRWLPRMIGLASYDSEPTWVRPCRFTIQLRSGRICEAYYRPDPGIGVHEDLNAPDVAERLRIRPSVHLKGSHDRNSDGYCSLLCGGMGGIDPATAGDLRQVVTDAANDYLCPLPKPKGKKPKRQTCEDCGCELNSDGECEECDGAE